MELYAGIDLHSNNNFLAVIDDQDKRLYQKRLPNQPDVVLAELAPFHEWISVRGQTMQAISRVTDRPWTR